MESSRASECLKAVLGDQYVNDDEITLNNYAASISGSYIKPACVVFPADEAAVISVVKTAGEKQLQLYPVSRGKNYGYGDAQGCGEGQVIVDLSTMQRIIEVNEKLAYIKIEPGVSQQQLYEFLSEKKSRLQADVTGAGLAASIAGNILERGFGHTDYGDRYARMISMSVVTPSGAVIRTGFSDYEGCNTASLYRYGLGPVIDGLFSQSNFGIVTEMTLELMPRPETMEMFVFSSKNENDIGNIVEAVRELRLKGIVNSAVHIANKSRAVGEKENRLAGAWNLSASVSGPANVVRAKKRIVKKTFRKYIKSFRLVFVNDRLMSVLQWIHHSVKRLSVYEPLKDVYDLQKGIPTDNPLRTLLNDDNIKSSELSPSQYSTCFSWINAVCSAEASSVAKLLNLISRKFNEDGYEFRVTFTSLNPRVLIMIANIFYHRDDASIAKANKFLKECSALLIEHGFFPYRSGPGLYEKLPVAPLAYRSFIKDLKRAIDPEGIIAPGKYNI